MNSVLRYLRKCLKTPPSAELSDGQLLERFVTQREEAAFEFLFHRYALLVLGVCQRVLSNPHDIEDAFQATFLVLVRKAATLDRGRSLAPWLHAVAYHLALRVRTNDARRRRAEKQVPTMPAAVDDETLWRDLRPVLDQEVNRLSEKYRTPVILCWLQGKTYEEAARELGWPHGTVAGRLARAKKLLYHRLIRRGITLSVGVLTAGLAVPPAPAVPSALLQTTLRAALLCVAGKTAATNVFSTRVISLTEGVLRTMIRTKVRNSLIVLLTIGLAGGGSVLAYWLKGSESPTEIASSVGAPAPLEKPALPAPTVTEWRVYGGNASRSAQTLNHGPDAGVATDGVLYGDIILLGRDEQGRKKAIEAAVDYINDGKWAIAITRLQKLLEIKEDVFVRLTRKRPDGKEVLAWVSVKQEANRLIGTLPPAGLDFYKLTFGAKAADLLKKAQQSGDPSLVAEVIKRYAYTDAGGQAIKMLADYRLDRTPGRGNQPVGGLVFMTPIWGKDLPYHAVYRKLERAEELLKGRNQPILPAFSPITVTAAKGGQKESLLIYRDYEGITARKLKDGELAWYFQSPYSLKSMLSTNKADAFRSQAINNWLQFYLDPNQRPQILFENSTVGTLSTDGKYVYVVEDFAVPPPPMMNVNNGDKKIQDAIHYSRLQVFDLSGKLTWEPGGQGPLSDCYFLGPPLPLDDKLYVLIQKDGARTGELRLVCLDPSKVREQGFLEWQAALATVPERMQQTPFRRIQALHVAAADGLLICPTHAGSLIAVDQNTHKIRWTYTYRKAKAAAPAAGSEWTVTAPVLHDGKIVFTAPDGQDVYCVNLKTGAEVWKAARDKDLYLGGVSSGSVLLVGPKRCRALRLSDGKPRWNTETGLPSGQGALHADHYYLPLQAAASGKPEICVLDIAKGTVVKRLRLPNDAVPGNLVFTDGILVSQGVRSLIACVQEKDK